MDEMPRIDRLELYAWLKRRKATSEEVARHFGVPVQMAASRLNKAGERGYAVRVGRSPIRWTAGPVAPSPSRAAPTKRKPDRTEIWPWPPVPELCKVWR